VKRADAIRLNRQIASGQLGRSRAREARDEHGIRAEAGYRAADLPREVSGFACPQLRGAEDAEFPRTFGPRLLLRNLGDAVSGFK